MKQGFMPAWMAILINVNIVVGGAFFLIAPKLSALGGILSPLAWIFCGILLVPLVFAFSHLAHRYPTAGGMYVYSQNQLGNAWGFISGWGCYIGTVAGNAVVLNGLSNQLVQVSLLQKPLAAIGCNASILNCIILCIFTWCNLKNIEFFERLQLVFTIIKCIPIVALFIVLFTYSGVSVPTYHALDVSGLFHMVPFVLFSYIGIEASTAIADKIENSSKNASRVILTSFTVIVLIYAALQYALECVFKTVPANPFVALVSFLPLSPEVTAIAKIVIECSILVSFLAGFYGMFYFNNWNLLVLGKEKSIVGANHLIRLNKNNVPWICVLIQSVFIGILILFVSHADYLYSMGDFGTSIAYVLSAAAFFTLRKSTMSILALATSALWIAICTYNLAHAGLISIVPFIGMLIAGLIGHMLQKTTFSKTI